MRKLSKNSMLFILAWLMIISSAFSSDRVDFLIHEDSIHELDLIGEQLVELDQLKFQIQQLELNVSKNETGEKGHLKFEKVAGEMVILSVVTGATSIYFPLGLRPVVSANIVSREGADGRIELSDKYVIKILNSVVLLKLKISSAKKALIKKSKYFCGIVSTHSICQ